MSVLPDNGTLTRVDVPDPGPYLRPPPDLPLTRTPRYANKQRPPRRSTPHRPRTMN